MNSMPRALLGVLLLATAALAGCADDAPVEERDDDPDLEGLELAADDGLGVIRGVVVDAAIRPLSGVSISVVVNADDATTFSNEAGAFGFSNVPPGQYVIEASKAGYFAGQATASVVAGDERPPAVKIQLDVDASTTPYVQPETYTGFIECTTSQLVVCGAPNLVSGLVCDNDGPCLGEITKDRYTPTIDFDHNATLIQTEMVWESSQAFSPDLFLQQEALESGCEGNRTLLLNAKGPSPILAPVPGDILADAGIGGEACGIYYSVFSGGVTQTPDLPPYGPLDIGFTVQQDFQLFIHAFYHFLPDEGWRFTEHGEPRIPS